MLALFPMICLLQLIINTFFFSALYRMCAIEFDDDDDDDDKGEESEYLLLYGFVSARNLGSNQQKSDQSRDSVVENFGIQPV